jgi:ribosome-associated heat shock protein Hsp15
MTALRLDKWLWFARFCKSRALAQRLIERGQVTLNGMVAEKTAAVVRSGDKLAVVIGATRRSVVVKDVTDHRGPAPEARALYEETAVERLAAVDAALPLRTPLR